jgi:pantothenate kinase
VPVPDRAAHPEQIVVSEVVPWIRARADPSRRFLFGIAGPPGSGKSTVAAAVAAELGAVVVPMDGYHLPNVTLDERGLRAVKGAPGTFDADAFVDAVRCVAASAGDVELPDFDRDIDEPRPGRILVRAGDPIVIVEGNYLLLDSAPWAALHDLFDAVAWLDVDPTVRVARLVDRHVRFGRTRREAAAFVEASDEINAARVEADRHRAHLVIRS